jgi:hypothetical protein
MKLELKGWVSANNEQNQGPRTPVRVATLNVTPEITGGNPSVANGKLVGTVTLQNLTPEQAALFTGGPEVTITIAVTPSAV